MAGDAAAMQAWIACRISETRFLAEEARAVAYDTEDRVVHGTDRPRRHSPRFGACPVILGNDEPHAHPTLRISGGGGRTLLPQHRGERAGGGTAWSRTCVLGAKLDEDEDDRLGELASGWCVQSRWSRWRCDRAVARRSAGPAGPG